jgi:hypothetical protein
MHVLHDFYIYIHIHIHNFIISEVISCKLQKIIKSIKIYRENLLKTLE